MSFYIVSLMKDIFVKSLIITLFYTTLTAFLDICEITKWHIIWDGNNIIIINIIIYSSMLVELVCEANYFSTCVIEMFLKKKMWLKCSFQRSHLVEMICSYVVELVISNIIYNL